MGWMLNARRRHINGKGRSMTLQRAPSGATVTVMGYPRDYRPQELAGGLMQGDAKVSILADEIAAASWPTPIVKPDRLTYDSRTRTVQGVETIYEGSTVIGYDLWVRGG